MNKPTVLKLLHALASVFVLAVGLVHADSAPSVRELANTSVRFADGRKYQLGKFLGAGDRTAVYALANDPKKAIRIPLRPEYRFLIREAVNGYDLLSRAGLDLPKIHKPVPRANDYLIVDRIPEGLSFDDLVHNPKVDQELRKKMIAELVNVARKTAFFSRLSDFRPNQFVFVPEWGKWILLDWRDAPVPAFLTDRNGRRIAHKLNAFTHFFYEYLTVNARPLKPEYNWVKELHEQIQGVIRDEQHRIIDQGILLSEARLTRAGPPCVSPRVAASRLFAP